MRAVHNTAIPFDTEFLVPDDCSCDEHSLVWIPCPACDKVLSDDAKAQLSVSKATRDTFKEIDPHTGIDVPKYVDGISCHECDAPIGWSSDGSFVDFWFASDETWVCDDCVTV